MKSERKILIQEKRIKELEAQLKDERDSAAILEKENADLKEKIEAVNSNKALLQTQTEDVIENLKNEIDKLRIAHREYAQLIEEVKVKRKQYENKMADLLKDFKVATLRSRR